MRIRTREASLVEASIPLSYNHTRLGHKIEETCGPSGRAVRSRHWFIWESMDPKQGNLSRELARRQRVDAARM